MGSNPRPSLPRSDWAVTWPEQVQKRSGTIAVRLEDVHPRVVEATGSGMTYGRPKVTEDHADAVVLEAVFVLVVVVDLLGTGYSRWLSPAAPARVDQVDQASR